MTRHTHRGGRSGPAGTLVAPDQECINTLAPGMHESDLPHVLYSCKMTGWGVRAERGGRGRGGERERETEREKGRERAYIRERRESKNEQERETE